MNQLQAQLEQIQPLHQPVSYTHLDVYKRQAMSWTNTAIPTRLLCLMP